MGRMRLWVGQRWGLRFYQEDPQRLLAVGALIRTTGAPSSQWAFQGYWGPVLRTLGLVLCPGSSFFPFVSQVWAEASAEGREVGLGAGESGKREIGEPIPTFKFHTDTGRP